MKKSRYVISLLLNLAIIALEVVGLATSLFNGGVFNAEQLKMFTIDSNILMLIVAVVVVASDIVALVKKKPIGRVVSLLDFVGTLAVALTLVVVLAVLAPRNGVETIFGGYFLYLHFICPILAVVSFVFVDVDSKIKPLFSLYGLLPILLYGIPVVTLVLTGVVPMDGFYPFMNYSGSEAAANILITVGIVVGGYLLGLILISLHNLMHKIEGGEPEAAKEAATVSTEPEPAKAEETKPASANPGMVAAVECGTSSNEKEETKPEEPKPGAKTIEPTPATSTFDVQVIDDDDTNEEAEIAQEEKDEEEEKKKNPTSYMNRPRTYHISKQQTTGKWQVRLATGQKAIKLFDTQEQAIVYAKGLVKTQGGSIRVHKVTGKMRKH